MNKLIGRGINIGGALDTSQKEGERGVTLQEEYFQIIKDAGFNSIRLAVRWTRSVVDAATARRFSVSYWGFCSVFGMYDLQTRSWRRELLEAAQKTINANRHFPYLTNE